MIQAAMADSVNPHAVPQQYRTHRQNGALAYVDGDYVWDAEEQAAFPRLWRICVTGDPAMAPHARELDVERFDATPEHVPEYQTARNHLGEGHNTDVYCSRDTVLQVISACRFTWQELRWHIATLDNIWRTPAEIADELVTTYGVPSSFAGSSIVAIQWLRGTDYDVSSIWGNPAWSKG